MRSFLTSLRSAGTPDSGEKPALARLALEGSRLRLPEASRTPPGAASSAPPSFSSENGFQRNRLLTPDFAEKPGLAGLALEGSRLRLPEASRTPPGAASSAPPSFSSENGHRCPEFFRM